MAKLIHYDSTKSKTAVVIDIDRRINKWKYSLLSSLFLNAVLLGIIIYLKVR